MRCIKYFVTVLCLLFSLNVCADTCSYEEQIILNNDFSNVKITYEVISDDKINILIYNLTKNIFITYTNGSEENEEVGIYYRDTNNGKYIISKDAQELENYVFKIRSNISSCYDQILTTKNIIKPKYNKFSVLKICEDEALSNHTYCHKFITTEINKTEDEVENTLKEFLSQKVEKITTTQKIEEQKNDVQSVIVYSSTGLILILSIVIFLYIKKKRGEL